MTPKIQALSNQIGATRRLLDRTSPYTESDYHQTLTMRLRSLQLQLEDERQKEQRNPTRMPSPVLTVTGANPQQAQRSNGKLDRAAYNRAFRAYANGQDSKELRDITTGSGSGFFLIPQLFAPELTEAQRTFGPIGSLINTVTGTVSHRFSLSDDTANNFTVLAESTSTSGVESDPTLSSVLISETDSCVRVVKASLQTIADSAFSIESFTNEIAGPAFSQAVELNLTTGLDKVGGSQLLHTTTGGVVSVLSGTGNGNVTAAAAGAIASTDLDALYGALPRSYRVSKNARFMCSPGVEVAISSLKSSTGDYIYKRNPETGNLVIQGIDLVVNNAMPALSATGNKPLVILADWHRYWLAVNSGLRVQVLRERYIDQMEVGFVLSYRTGSAQGLPAAGVALVSHT